MICCDRCRVKAKYHNVVGNKNVDLCVDCYSAIEDIRKTFDEIEQDFMKMKLTHIKHIDFD